MSAGTTAGRSAPAIDLDSLRERYVDACSAAAAATFEQAITDVGESARTADGYARLVHSLAERIGDTEQASAFRREAGLEG